MGRLSAVSKAAAQPFAPRVWGWAGIDQRGGRAGASLPHACGDGPELDSCWMTGHSVCPTRVGMGRGPIPWAWQPPAVCPTRVGMGRSSFRVAIWASIVCPTRVGMGRSAQPWRSAPAAFAPRVWGWAGHRYPGHQPAGRLPHACGDGPENLGECFTTAERLPHACGDGPAAPDRTPPSRRRLPHACGDGPV